MLGIGASTSASSRFSDPRSRPPGCRSSSMAFSRLSPASALAGRRGRRDRWASAVPAAPHALTCSTTCVGSTTIRQLAGLGGDPLKGELKGHYAVTVSGTWRVTFRFQDGDALDVDYLDYH